jgi:hypothetical protein
VLVAKVIALIFGAFLFVGVILQFYYPPGRHNGGGRISCLSNVKQLGLAFRMYEQDYDERYPLSPSWNEDIYPYTKNTHILHCPYASGEPLPTYAMNRQLKSVLLARIETPTNTVMLFDSIPSRNLSGGRELLPIPTPRIRRRAKTLPARSHRANERPSPAS